MAAGGHNSTETGSDITSQIGIVSNSLHFDISHANPDGEKMTQPDNDTVPFVTDSRGISECCCNRHGNDSLCPTMHRALEEARSGLGFSWTCRHSLKLRVPSPKERGVVPGQSAGFACWSEDFPGLEHSAQGPCSSQPQSLPPELWPFSSGRKRLLRPQQSPASPPSLLLPGSTALTSAAQTPLQPSGTAFLCLHLINPPSHFIFP